MNRGSAWLLAVVLACVPASVRAAAPVDLVGQTVAVVRVFQDGVVIDDRTILELIETRTSQPFSLRQVRESVLHLFTRGYFAEVRVSAAAEPRSVVVRYDLFPVPTTGAVDFRGSLGLPAEELLGPITRRFGRAVRTDQIPAAVAMLEDIYQEAGRFAVRISTDTVDGRLVFDVDQGPAALIGHIDFRGVSDENRPGVLRRLELAEGVAYDPADLETRLDDYEADLRGQRYYEARLRHDVSPSPDGRVVDVVLDIQTGSPVGRKRSPARNSMLGTQTWGVPS
ncbi:MAG TPA: hypothetical protein EYQ83_07685 [Acidobacteria bacterium]|nr:hypothetical protein [Acidobacteriota bacterium]